MKLKFIFPIAIAIVTVSFSCSTENQGSNETTEVTDTTKKEIVASSISEDVDAEKFRQLIESGTGLLLDVRTPEEYAAGNIAGSTNLNFKSSDFEASLDTLDKNTPVYVYCQSGGRSGQAKDMMTQKGFKEVYNLTGGFGNWPY